MSDKQLRNNINNSMVRVLKNLRSEEGGHEVMSQQQLVRSDDIPRARIRGYKLQGSFYGLNHDRWIGFSTKPKSSIWLVKNDTSHKIHVSTKLPGGRKVSHRRPF